MIVSATNYSQFKSNISSFFETFQQNFSHEYIKSFKIEPASLLRNILNSETEGNLSLSFGNTFGIVELPCFHLSLSPSFMECSKLLGSFTMMIFVAS